MGEKIRWIRDDEALAAHMRNVRAGALAVDTESDSMHHYPERVCLVQITHAGEDALIDPLAGVDLSGLRSAFEDRSIAKLLHGADYDLRLLHRDHGLVVAGLFDTMIAARLTGERAFGLASLLERHFDVRLDKKYQRANWAIRPLTPEMERYAAMDTRYLEDLAGRLRDRLRALGRESWAEEEFRKLEGVRFRERDDDEELFRRVKGHGKLRPRAQAILERLCLHREALARRKARPPFRIVGDAALLQLAESPARDEDGLREIHGLPRSLRGGAGARRLLEVIDEARDLPPEAWPKRPPTARRPRRSPEFEARLRALKRHRDAVAARLDLEPSVVAPRAILEGMVEREERGEDPLGLADLARWQAEVLRGLPGSGS